MGSQSLLSSLPVEVFDSIFNSAFDGIAISEQGKILYVNPQLASMFEYTVDEMVGRYTYDMSATPGTAQLVRENSLSREGGTYVGAGLTKSGRTIHAEIRGIPFEWQGRTLRLTAMRDITSAREADARLKESEHRFRTVFEMANEGIWQVDAENKTVFVNPKMAEYLGYAPEEMVGRSVYDFLPKDIHPAIDVKIAERRKGKREQYDVCYLRKDGSLIWMINSAAPLYGPDGSHIGALGLHTDITERRRVEDALRESNELFESTFEHASVGIGHTSPENQWLRFNQRLCEILGFTREKLKSTNILDIIHPEDRESNSRGYLKLLRGEIAQFSHEGRYLRGDGSWVWIRLTASMVRDEQDRPKYFVTICQDIDAEKAAEDKLADMRAQMLFSSKASTLGEIANGIAHEINNPLSIIRAYTDVLRDDLSAEQGDRARFLAHVDKIDATVGRITQIVRSLVVFTRDTNHEPFRKVSVAALIRDTLTLCENRFRNARIELEQGEISDSIEVECRSVPLSQVLLNLFYNAADAVEGGQVRWVRVFAEDLGDEVVIGVEDSGPGVDPESRSKIMQPFYTTKPPHRGTGLGLAISRKIVESHQGTLILDSESPHTRFVVRVPKRQVAV